MFGGNPRLLAVCEGKTVVLSMELERSRRGQPFPVEKQLLRFIQMDVKFVR